MNLEDIIDYQIKHQIRLGYFIAHLHKAVDSCDRKGFVSGKVLDYLNKVIEQHKYARDCVAIVLQMYPNLAVDEQKQLSGLLAKYKKHRYLTENDTANIEQVLRSASCGGKILRRRMNPTPNPKSSF